ncbi:hypothetical protein D3C71_768850 [compost metagenome]
MTNVMKDGFACDDVDLRHRALAQRTCVAARPSHQPVPPERVTPAGSLPNPLEVGRRITRENRLEGVGRHRHHFFS